MAVPDPARVDFCSNRFHRVDVQDAEPIFVALDHCGPCCDR